MTVKTIYIARHGYRSNWLPQGPYPPPPTGVDSDVPLAEHGLTQAKELGHYILSLNNQPELLFSSPFYRCIQTSEAIAALLELPIYLDTGIGEWYKPDRAIIPVPASYEVLSQLFPTKISDDWSSTILPSDKGETEEDIFNRCKTFWPKFIDTLEDSFPNIETIILVTHAATKIALGLSLLKKSSARDAIDSEGTLIRSGSCSLDKYELLETEYSKDDDSTFVLPFEKRTWKITMNGNTEYLTKGEEMNWNFQSSFEAGSDADIRARMMAAAEKGEAPDASINNSHKAETETVYVSVDIPSKNYRNTHTIDRAATLQYSGLEENSPLFKIGDKIYEGQWKKLVGTELAFPNAAKVMNKKVSLEHTIPKPLDLINQDNQTSNNASIDNPEEPTSVNSIATEKDKNDVHPEKIYKITDRIILSEVKPM
ncbi:hypothetical protein TPHA_0F01770 [Tetrapisispora phaffii CBS 4417]|uniref:Transcription factor TFIIIC triple barrel domain-containing protein n=1 Tax=Tetrapisispora phaffii (strain ATCC 24235 / CBS 4417 / NBRC 1672 / NRRL Y-8282 / UCD 70-5) TaxID=1071381 RepID=G8BV79_TETPH|nr:hypothetical protein TPHA_0F01770 [Tetrapisispora phaffii CBS 4417]CCE63661.1 hypothetical protein TPHA_0F01770 [Tetrapisispora phaffii CBS 4417]